MNKYQVTASAAGKPVMYTHKSCEYISHVYKSCIHWCCVKPSDVMHLKAKPALAAAGFTSTPSTHPPSS